MHRAAEKIACKWCMFRSLSFDWEVCYRVTECITVISNRPTFWKYNCLYLKNSTDTNFISLFSRYGGSQNKTWHRERLENRLRLEKNTTSSLENSFFYVRSKVIYRNLTKTIWSPQKSPCFRWLLQCNIYSTILLFPPKTCQLRGKTVATDARAQT